MSIYFRGHSGIAWNTYGPGPGQVPSLSIPYPSGIQVGDFLVVMSYRYITEASVDLAHWTPMGLRGGYTPIPYARLAYWAIADAADVAAGTLDVVCNWTTDEYHMNAVHGLMAAWKPRLNFDPAEFFVGYRTESLMPWPAWSLISGDLSMAVGMGGANYHDPPYQSPTLSWGAYTEEFQVQDTLTHDHTSTLPPSIPETQTENASYGAAYYPLTDGTIPSTSFATSTDDPAGGDGRFFQMFNAGTSETVGYWGILIGPA